MLESMNKEEVVAMLRRSSTGFSRGASKFRGVTRHHQHGKWEARIGRVAGNKYLVTHSWHLHAKRLVTRGCSTWARLIPKKPPPKPTTVPPSNFAENASIVSQR